MTPRTRGIDLIRNLLPDVVLRLRRAGCVFAEDEARILADGVTSETELEERVSRREGGERLEHIVGWTEFAGLRVPVHEGVFVPRYRTELLASQAIEALPDGGTLVELCCGAAPIAAVALASARGAQIYAADIDTLAVENARMTFARFGGASDGVHEGDLFDALPPGLAGAIDVLVFNAPYVPTDELRYLPGDATSNESPVALDGGVDGLRIVGQVLAKAADWLRPGGALMFEAGHPQVDSARKMVRDAGFRPKVITDEETGGIVILGVLD